MSQLSPLDGAFYAAAHTRLRTRLEEGELDGTLLLSPANIFYLTGFSYAVNERPVGLFIPVSGNPVLFVPRLEVDHATSAGIEAVRVYDEFPGVQHPVLWMIEHCAAPFLAVDTLEAPIYLEAKASLIYLEVRDLVLPLRAVKTPAELELICAAAAFADLCLERVLACAGAIIGRGGSERDILHDAVMFAAMRLQEATGPAFEHTKSAVVGTVHSGPRAALPHGQTSHRVPGRGDTLIAGIGACVGGYHAESGATFTVGEASTEQLRCLEAAQTCDVAAALSLRVGATGAEVNEAALSVLRQAGLGDAIRHRIGHGMGVEGHEAPWLAPGGNTPCEAGMVFSSEPGIYRPSVDGYRTINTMILTETGVQIPSTFQARTPLGARVLEL